MQSTRCGLSVWRRSFHNFYGPSYHGSWISSNLGQSYGFLLLSWFSDSYSLFCGILPRTASLTMFSYDSHILVSLSRHFHPSILCSLLDIVILQSKAGIQELYMGRNPPIFTSMRVLPETSDDDHLVGTTFVWSEYFLYFYGQLTIICVYFNAFIQVLELGMNFLSGEDMSAVLAMQLHKSVGLGMTAKMHLTSMHVEGKAS